MTDVADIGADDSTAFSSTGQFEQDVTAILAAGSSLPTRGRSRVMAKLAVGAGGLALVAVAGTFSLAGLWRLATDWTPEATVGRPVSSRNPAAVARVAERLPDAGVLPSLPPRGVTRQISLEQDDMTSPADDPPAFTARRAAGVRSAALRSASLDRMPVPDEKPSPAISTPLRIEQRDGLSLQTLAAQEPAALDAIPISPPRIDITEVAASSDRHRDSALDALRALRRQ